MRIFLNGFMACGKTTIGKILASRLKLGFIDLDECIENKFGATIRYIFEQEGEDSFRNKEREILHDVIKKDNVVISTGGGAPCFFDNMDVMNKHGITVYLDLDVDTLTQRLEQAKDYRPLIWGKSREDLKNYITNTIAKRNDFYRKAQYTVNAKDLKVEDILGVLKGYAIG